MYGTRLKIIYIYKKDIEGTVMRASRICVSTFLIFKGISQHFLQLSFRLKVMDFI
jgi:hypothetical protein